MAYFFQRLEAKMTELGISGVRLAEQLGVSPMAVSNWRNANSQPRRDTLERLASVLGTTVEYLRDGTPNEMLPQQIGRGPTIDELVAQLQSLVSQRLDVPKAAVRVLIHCDLG